MQKVDGIAISSKAFTNYERRRGSLNCFDQTVSAVVNNKEAISQATSERVLAFHSLSIDTWASHAACELVGYTPLPYSDQKFPLRRWQLWHVPLKTKLMPEATD